MNTDIKRRVFIGVLTLVIMTGLFLGGYRAGASSSGAGSSSDPLITKSYLDKRLSELDAGASGFRRVEVLKGEKLVASEGSLLFMYSGAGSIAAGEFADVSSGDVFSRGNTMVLYNLFFSAKNGNSIAVTSNAVFYVQGNYTVE